MVFKILAFQSVFVWSACQDGAEPHPDALDSQSSVAREAVSYASYEAWDPPNDPAYFSDDLELSFWELRQNQQGASSIVPWPDTYWPMKEDGYNARWQGADTLSPLELYDRAFNGWVPQFTKPDGGQARGFDEFSRPASVQLARRDLRRGLLRSVGASRSVGARERRKPPGTEYQRPRRHRGRLGRHGR